MGKKQVMISIDSDIADQAKEKLSGRVSAICERALRQKVQPKKNDLPEEILEMRCKKCNKITKVGFFCQILKTLYCDECEKTRKCVPTQHEHTRIPRLEQ